jgi:ABC-type metal ion transport system substrate-binding protein
VVSIEVVSTGSVSVDVVSSVDDKGFDLYVVEVDDWSDPDELLDSGIYTSGK